MYKQEVLNPILFNLLSSPIYDLFGACILIIILRSIDIFLHRDHNIRPSLGVLW